MPVSGRRSRERVNVHDRRRFNHPATPRGSARLVEERIRETLEAPRRHPNYGRPPRRRGQRAACRSKRFSFTIPPHEEHRCCGLGRGGAAGCRCSAAGCLGFVLLRGHRARWTSRYSTAMTFPHPAGHAADRSSCVIRIVGLDTSLRRFFGRDFEAGCARGLTSERGGDGSSRSVPCRRIRFSSLIRGQFKRATPISLGSQCFKPF